MTCPGGARICQSGPPLSPPQGDGEGSCCHHYRLIRRVVAFRADYADGRSRSALPPLHASLFLNRAFYNPLHSPPPSLSRRAALDWNKVFIGGEGGGLVK